MSTIKPVFKNIINLQYNLYKKCSLSKWSAASIWDNNSMFQRLSLSPNTQVPFHNDTADCWRLQCI